VIARLFSNWRFRSAKPVLVPGESIRAYLTAFDAGTGEGTVRIGDTRLTVTGAAAAQLDQLVDLRVESFDVTTATGRAVLRA
jgi:hypothetical protein